MTDREQIAAAEERLWAAVVNENKNALRQLLHHNMVFIDQRGQVVTDAEDPYTYQFGNLHLEKLNVYDKQINTTGDTAMVLVIEKISVRRQSIRVESRYLRMRVWKKKEGSWKITAVSSSAMPMVECVVSDTR